MSACGSRTGLGLLASETSLQDGGPSDAADAAEASDGGDARDVFEEIAPEDVTDAPRCGAPWVLFGLSTSTEGGAMESYQVSTRPLRRVGWTLVPSAAESRR